MDALSPLLAVVASLGALDAPMPQRWARTIHRHGRRPKAAKAALKRQKAARKRNR